MNFCFDNHLRSSDSLDGCALRSYGYGTSKAPIILIDTGRLCLINALTSYRFVALSYVW